MNDPSAKWTRKTKNFIDHAFSLLRIGADVQCPCHMCRICRCQDKRTHQDIFAKMATCLTMKPGCITVRSFAENVAEAHSNDEMEYDRMVEGLVNHPGKSLGPGVLSVAGPSRLVLRPTELHLRRLYIWRRRLWPGNVEDVLQDTVAASFLPSNMYCTSPGRFTGHRCKQS
jgi:hypothetical protein